MITDQDITKLKKVFATKEDLKRFAKKDDLKSFATKKDLERYATKEELEELCIDMNDGFYVLNNKLDTFIVKMEDGFDMIVGAIHELRDENRIGAYVQGRHTRQIDAIAKHIDFDLPE